MTEAKTKNQINNQSRWLASEYREATSPSMFFRLTIGLLIAIWLGLTGWIVINVQTVGSPDEAANKYLMSALAQTGQYLVDTGVSDETLQYLHPRSMAVQGQFIASGSFLGLVQVGAVLIKLFGAGAERMMIPLLSLGGLLAMFFVWRRFWGRWWSLLAVGLIALHPAWFEYATLPYMHNGAFAAGLMIAVWATIRLLERPIWINSLLVGLTFGGALFFRPVEALWTVPTLVILLLARKMWRELLLVCFVVIAIQLPWLLANREVYGSFLSSGYTPNGVFSDAVENESIIGPIGNILTPLGGWSWHWLSSTWWYFIMLVPAWSVMGAVALGRYFRRKYVTLGKAVKLTGLSLIGIFPLVYYGSWNLYPTTPAADIGALASYTRYWLPLYILMVPGVIIILRTITRRWSFFMATIALVISQAATIWIHPVSGLKVRLAAGKKNSDIRQRVLAATETNAILIAGHADKYFQDQRLSGFSLPRNETEWQLLRQLVTARPVYLYVAVGAVDTAAAQTAMSAYGLQMEQRLTIGRDVLWKLALQS